MTNEEARAILTALKGRYTVPYVQEAIDLAISALTQPNEPLTLDELREMDGEPVWVEDVNHWALVEVENYGRWTGIPFAVWPENGLRFTYNIEDRDLHCYRRPPEGAKNE